ncbi:hypothetical protein ABK040_012425 [Willaertia magna]
MTSQSTDIAVIPPLFTPLTIRGLTLKNRIVISPMCMFSSKDGFANFFHVQHIGSRAIGGAGLFVVEATSVSPIGRISPHDLGIWKDDHIPMLKGITDMVHEFNSHICIQLAHAGRKASMDRKKGFVAYHAVPIEEGGWDVVSPSPVAFDTQYKVPKELSVEEIKEVVQEFVEAAKRSVQAGFDVIEIHGAHGYLIHSFYSPKANFRTDEYGGSFENRIRFLMEIVKGVRAVIPEEMPLFVRISAVEYVEDGWQIEDSVKLAKILKENGVDLIDCSTGGIIALKYISYDNYQVPYAEQIKREAGILTGAVGMIKEGFYCSY